MALSTESLKQIAQEHFNELVIAYGFNVLRFVGYAETDEDYYYVIKNSDNKYSYLSCVGGLIYLKNKIDDSEYEALDSILAINGCPKEEKLIEKITV